MKKNVTLILSLISSIIISQTCLVKAQHYSGQLARNINKDASELIVHHLRNNVSFIRVDENKIITPAEAVGWLKQDVLKARAEDNLVSYQKNTDNIGFTHDRYRQYYKGIEVEYGVYYVHAKSGRVISANGEWYDKINIPTSPKLSAKNAYEAATAHVNAQVYRHDLEDQDNNKLMILPVDGSFKLVYRCDVYSSLPYKRSYLYVDASDGSIVKEVSRIHDLSVHGSAQTQYSGVQTIGSDSLSPTSFRLREYFRGAGVETYDFSAGGADYYDADNNFVTFNILDVVAYDAHFGAEATYDFYDQNFGWKSVDGNGQKKLLSYVHNNGAGAINAFWDGNAMNYGDGDPQHGVGALTSLDICGHELTHGVTENSSGLIYSGESGGLNESFSDISGITIRFQHVPNATWLIDDQEGFAFRDMSNPKVFNCPDTYNGTFWNFGDGVHFNSGVQNFWFYLLSDGKSGTNDVGDVYNVQGIGVMNAVKIAVRSNMQYLTPNSDFQDARDMSIQAAIDLYGSCSNEVIQTANAWYAVNVGELYSSSVNAIFISAQTYYCSAPASVSFTNKSNNATSYSWTFGDGGTSVLQNPTHIYNNPGTYTVSLTANGSSTCGTSNTLTYTNYITVANTGAPVTPSCTPTTTGNAGMFGIYRFIFNTIDNKTPANDKYKDYSCSKSTTVVAGSQYNFQIFTNGNVFYENPAEDVRIWIDYDNNGVFDNVNELAYSKDNDSTIMKGIIRISTTATTNIPLRLRVMDDKASSTITGPCYTPVSGQCEDYSVVVLPASSAPVPDFMATPSVIGLGQSVKFTDLSQNGPTSWQWTFEGGSPSTSTIQNPTGIVYSTAGSYDVTLTAGNAFGSNTVTKTNSVTVNPVFNMCQYTEAPYSQGGFFDPGGPFASSPPNQNCSLLINPPCAGPITLQITTFMSQLNMDVLKIYNGSDVNAPLLASISGNVSLPITLIATSGRMFATWVTDATVNSKGFYATWSSQEGGFVPTGVNVSNITATSATLNWNAVNGAAKYKVRYKVAGTSVWTTVTANTNSYQLTGLTPNTKYAYGVRTICTGEPAAKSDWTETAKFKTASQRVDVVSNASDIEIYPNPTASFSIVAFQLDHADRVMIQLYSEEGKLIETFIDENLPEGNHQIRISTDHLSTGFYHVKISMGQEVNWKKLIRVE